jgi:hypothetical protein
MASNVLIIRGGEDAGPVQDRVVDGDLGNGVEHLGGLRQLRFESLRIDQCAGVGVVVAPHRAQHLRACQR